jgi:hypothetical protein
MSRTIFSMSTGLSGEMKASGDPGQVRVIATDANMPILKLENNDTLDGVKVRFGSRRDTSGNGIVTAGARRLRHHVFA